MCNNMKNLLRIQEISVFNHQRKFSSVTHKQYKVSRKFLRNFYREVLKCNNPVKLKVSPRIRDVLRKNSAVN